MEIRRTQRRWVFSPRRFDAALRPGQPQQSYVSQATVSPGFAPRWQGNVSLAWEHGAWSASAIGRYTGEYDDYLAYAPANTQLGDFWLVDNVRLQVTDLFPGVRGLKDGFVSVGA